MSHPFGSGILERINTDESSLMLAHVLDRHKEQIVRKNGEDSGETSGGQGTHQIP